MDEKCPSSEEIAVAYANNPDTLRARQLARASRPYFADLLAEAIIAVKELHTVGEAFESQAARTADQALSNAFHQDRKPVEAVFISSDHIVPNQVFGNRPDLVLIDTESAHDLFDKGFQGRRLNAYIIYVTASSVARAAAAPPPRATATPWSRTAPDPKR